jgi:hypothetical protein
MRSAARLPLNSNGRWLLLALPLLSLACPPPLRTDPETVPDGSIVNGPKPDGSAPVVPGPTGMPDADPTFVTDASNPTDAPLGCPPGETRCAPSAGNIVEVCSITGAWTMKQRCEAVCASGACAGKCTPGARQCGANQTPEVCSAAGEWMPDKQPCEFVCAGDGQCGECKPASRRCGASNTPEVCSIAGKWEAAPAPCEFVCAGEGVCGECKPDSKTCVGLTQRVCDANGKWQTAMACKFVCTDGECEGTCKPGDQRCSGNTPQMCDAGGTYRSLPACPFVCSGNGSCSGECKPNTTTCSGTRRQVCNGNGQLSTEDCRAPQHGSATCSGGNCGFSCQSPFVKRGNNCACPDGQVECNGSCAACCGTDAGNCPNPGRNREKFCQNNQCRPRPGCDLTGTWTQASDNGGCMSSTWTFNNGNPERTHYTISEGGCGFAGGEATYDGSEIVANFITGATVGTYRWKVNGDCTSGGAGDLTFTAPPELVGLRFISTLTR